MEFQRREQLSLDRIESTLAEWTDITGDLVHEQQQKQQQQGSDHVDNNDVLQFELFAKISNAVIKLIHNLEA